MTDDRARKAWRVRKEQQHDAQWLNERGWFLAGYRERDAEVREQRAQTMAMRCSADNAERAAQKAERERDELRRALAVAHAETERARAEAYEQQEARVRAEREHDALQQADVLGRKGAARAHRAGWEAGRDYSSNIPMHDGATNEDWRRAIRALTYPQEKDS